MEHVAERLAVFDCPALLKASGRYFSWCAARQGLRVVKRTLMAQVAATAALRHFDRELMDGSNEFDRGVNSAGLSSQFPTGFNGHLLTAEHYPLVTG